MLSHRSPWLWLIASAVLGLFFLLIPYVARMWAAGHYQFFPLVFIAVAMLLWARRGEIADAQDQSHRGLLIVGIFTLAALVIVANVLYSNFLAIAITVASLALGVYAVFGRGGLLVSAPILALLVFVIPLPMRMDEALIIRMQFLASHLASRLLDGIGVIHFRQGVILQTEGASFLTEEACSGVRSLFSSLAVVAVFAVAMKHRALRLLVNLVQTLFWVVIGNSLRIAIVVALAEQAPWLASGMGHEILGLLVFAFILAMVASTDAALVQMFSSRFYVRSEDAVLSDKIRRTHPIQLDYPTFPLSGPSRKALFGLLALMVLISLRVAWVRRSEVASLSSLLVSRMQAPDPELLSGEIAGFEQKAFRHEQRSSHYLLADESYVWQFNNGATSAIVSLDGPWSDWHDLNNCYRGVGWTTRADYFLTPGVPLVEKSEAEDSASSNAGDAGRGSFTHSELMMERAGQYGFVIFSAIDRDGQDVAEGIGASTIRGGGWGGGWRERSAVSLGLGDRQVDFVAARRLPVSTVQVYAESLAPLTDQDLDRLRELFFRAREQIVAARRASS